jgi:hypothetical protein
MCKPSPAWSRETGVRGDVIELTRTDRELAYLLSQFMSARPGVATFDVFAPKAALPKAVVSVRPNEWRLWGSAVAAWNDWLVREAGVAFEDVVCPLWAACEMHGAMGGLWVQLQSESGRKPLPRCHSDKFDYQQMDTHIGSRNPATPGPSDIAQSRFIRAEVFASLTP